MTRKQAQEYATRIRLGEAVIARGGPGLAGRALGGTVVCLGDTPIAVWAGWGPAAMLSALRGRWILPPPATPLLPGPGRVWSSHVADTDYLAAHVRTILALLDTTAAGRGKLYHQVARLVSYEKTREEICSYLQITPCSFAGHVCAARKAGLLAAAPPRKKYTRKPRPADEAPRGPARRAWLAQHLAAMVSARAP